MYDERSFMLKVLTMCVWKGGVAKRLAEDKETHGWPSSFVVYFVLLTHWNFMFSSPFPHINNDVHMDSGSEVKRNKIINIYTSSSRTGSNTID